MAYDSAVVSFTTKTDKVDLVQAAHMNAVQTELIAIETMLGTGIRGSAADLKTRLAICLAATGGIQSGANLPCSSIAGQLFFRTSDKKLFAGSGSDWNYPTAPSGVFNHMEVFTSSGTWTKPTSVSQVYVKVVGGGGGGGSTDGSNVYSGGGGGAGGYSEGLVTVTGNVTVTVGDAGAAGSASDGGNGGASSFAGSTTPTGNGGTGGKRGVSTGAQGGTGGSAANGTLNIPGGCGNAGGSSVPGGLGGSSVFGGGGKGGVNGIAENGTAGATNSGGGGGGSGFANVLNGGAGAKGVVIVYWNE